MDGRKDDQPPKRLSTIRKRHATPSLPLQASRSHAPQVPRAPIVHEDDDADPASIDTEALPPLPSAKPAERQSHPLQEVSPNRSPRKASSQQAKKAAGISSETFGKPSSRTVSPEKDASPKPPDAATVGVASESNEQQQGFSRPREQLTADLTELLNRQTASRPGSACASAPPAKRKSRSLGRAASGISSRSLSVCDVLSQSADAAAVDGFSAAVAEPAPPSTQLGYETPEAEAHRLQMGKRMGMQFSEEGGLRRVASVGTVRDSSFGSEGGVGGRVKGRRGAR